MTEFAYIGTKSCGCTVAAVVDNPKHSKDVANAVSKFIRGGLKIERVSVERVRELFPLANVKKAIPTRRGKDRQEG